MIETARNIPSKNQRKWTTKLYIDYIIDTKNNKTSCHMNLNHIKSVIFVMRNFAYVVSTFQKFIHFAIKNQNYDKMVSVI